MRCQRVVAIAVFSAALACPAGAAAKEKLDGYVDFTLVHEIEPVPGNEDPRPRAPSACT
jgi:hypothetical protein